jgi:hypothetical protein
MPQKRLIALSVFVVVFVFVASNASAQMNVADVTGGHAGKTIYVSKLGDNTDGSSWAKGFHTIQAALSAIPDDLGGHVIAIRPDTYIEANLYTDHKGAKGAYNMMTGDFDGALGSGAKGWVILDSGCPDAVVRTNTAAGGANPPFKILDSGAPEPGLKCIDWWGPIKCDPTYSAVNFDRWIFRNIYACGSEGGIGWDLTCAKGSEFSVIEEDCFGIGRFAGTCVGAFIGRENEPVTFRRCKFWCLDWWGDACGAYIRAENKTMPNYPDVVFDDCTLVGLDNALQAGNPGFDGYTHVSLKNCRLIGLNFSQPVGKPGTGVIYSTINGKYLKVDLEDCLLMGYKLFGAGEGDVGFSLKGSVKAYVQYTQPVPEGIEKLPTWPVEAFNAILPPLSPEAARP